MEVLVHWVGDMGGNSVLELQEAGHPSTNLPVGNEKQVAEETLAVCRPWSRSVVPGSGYSSGSVPCLCLWASLALQSKLYKRPHFVFLYLSILCPYVLLTGQCGKNED